MNLCSSFLFNSKTLGNSLKALQLHRVQWLMIFPGNQYFKFFFLGDPVCQRTPNALFVRKGGTGREMMGQDSMWEISLFLPQHPPLKPKQLKFSRPLSGCRVEAWQQYLTTCLWVLNLCVCITGEGELDTSWPYFTLTSILVILSAASEVTETYFIDFDFVGWKQLRRHEYIWSVTPLFLTETVLLFFNPISIHLLFHFLYLFLTLEITWSMSDVFFTIKVNSPPPFPITRQGNRQDPTEIPLECLPSSSHHRMNSRCKSLDHVPFQCILECHRYISTISFIFPQYLGKEEKERRMEVSHAFGILSQALV